jgi:hypothetical protein
MPGWPSLILTVYDLTKNPPKTDTTEPPVPPNP